MVRRAGYTLARLRHGLQNGYNIISRCCRYSSNSFDLVMLLSVSKLLQPVQLSGSHPLSTWLCRKRERGLHLNCELHSGEAVQEEEAERPFKKQCHQVDIQAFTPSATPLQPASGRFHNLHRCKACKKRTAHHLEQGRLQVS